MRSVSSHSPSQLVGTVLPCWVLLANVSWTQLQSSPTGSLTVTCLWGWKVSGLSSQCSEMSETDLRVGRGEQCKVEFLCVSHKLNISECIYGSVNSRDRSS